MGMQTISTAYTSAFVQTIATATTATELNVKSAFTQTMAYNDNSMVKMRNIDVQTNTEEIDACNACSNMHAEIDARRLMRPEKHRGRSLAHSLTQEVKAEQDRIATMVKEQAARVKNEEDLVQARALKALSKGGADRGDA